MRKKILAAFIVAAGVAFAGYNMIQSQNEKDALADILMANVEALASDESGGNTVTCYSSSSAKSGATYYDCGNCSRQFNSKGRGDSSTCTTR